MNTPKDPTGGCCPPPPCSALFVPLTSRYYEAFERGEKTEELRLYGPLWNERTCRIGRPITLSKGYGKKNRLHGTIWKFKRQHGSTFGSTYKAAIMDRYKTLDVWIAVISVTLPNVRRQVSLAGGNGES